MRFVFDNQPLPVATAAGPSGAASKTGGIMKRVLFVSAAMLVLAGSAEARIFSQDDCDERCLISAQLLRPGEDDDAEVWRPGPRGEDREAIEAMPPGLREDDDDE